MPRTEQVCDRWWAVAEQADLGRTMPTDWPPPSGFPAWGIRVHRAIARADTQREANDVSVFNSWLIGRGMHNAALPDSRIPP